MTVFDTLAKQAGRLATDVQTSLRRARVEGERRLLQRQHRAALEELGERTYELVRSGQMEEGQLAPEVAAVESKLMEIEAKVTEIESLRDDEEEAPETGGEDSPPPDAARAAFPMAAGAAGDAGSGDAGSSSDPSPGPGWEAAGRFFRPGA